MDETKQTNKKPTTTTDLANTTRSCARLEPSIEIPKRTKKGGKRMRRGSRTAEASDAI